MALFFDWAAEAFGSVMRDVRQRVVERGWFGEAVTPRSQNITLGSLGEKSPAERLGWSMPGQEVPRSHEPGWFSRNFAPDASRGDAHAERAEQGREQSPSMER